MKCRLTFQGGHGMHEDACDKYMSIVVDVPDDVAKMCKEYGSTFSHVIATEWLAPDQVDHGIEKQPTVMRWIPVEERMPENGKYVLVSCVDARDDGVHRYTWVAAWDFDDFADAGWSWRFPECDDPNVDIVAWMSLPEIYQEKEGK